LAPPAADGHSPGRPDMSGRALPMQPPSDRLPARGVRGVYIISVAARILSMHPQTLRKYERVGLVEPSRTVGMLRLYSEEDISKLRLIKHLVDDLGLNLAGVELTLELINRLLRLRLDTSRAQDSAEMAQLVGDQLDAIFDFVNLFLPGKRG
jgi:MerR family transcriptional regulator/heat shock protein HspR